jgi:predicted nucleic acid-binding protein
MVAMFARREKLRERTIGLFSQATRERWMLSTTWPCVVEACHLLEATRRCALMQWLAAGAVSVYPFDQEVLEGMAELMRRYTETPRTEMDLADASLVWLASDTGVNRIMTTDVLDFSRYRLPDGRAFEIL